MKIKSNRIFFNIAFLILFTSVILADSRISKLSVSNLLKIGYDSNVSRISETESLDFNNSSFLSLKSSVNSSLKLLKRNTRINFSIKMNYYLDVEEKSNYAYYFNISQPIGNYQSIKYNYSFINDIYIRKYDDLDYLVHDEIYNGTNCFFDLIKYKISYESPYIGTKDKFELSIFNELQYYSPEFTEYDLSIIGGEMKIFTKQKTNKYNISLGFVQADTLYSHAHQLLIEDLDEGLTLRLVDRSYTERSVKISYDFPVNENVAGFSLSKKERKYLSESIFPIDINGDVYFISDDLHKDRKHQDYQIGAWYTFDNGNNKNKILFSYRKRITSSPHKWVENLKSFSKYNIEYNIYFNKIKLK